MTVRKVGSCRIVRELGRGGMGVVYEALQEGLDRRVAVKELPADVASRKEMAERFRREGMAYARLRHQSIVTVHDLVEKNDAIYLVTELVDGADLQKLLGKGGPFPPAVVAVIGARVAEALDHAHFNKLLHRDVKPSNVMLSRDGVVKLMDFGVVKDQAAEDLTREGMVVGTPAFLAPELTTGGKGTVQTDIWALGVTLYEIATGDRPYRAESMPELFAAIRSGKYRPVRSHDPVIPRALANIIQRCLKPRPRSRWRSAAELARELDHVAVKMLRGIHPQVCLADFMHTRGFENVEHATELVGGPNGATVDVGDDLVVSEKVSTGGLARWFVGGVVAAAAGGAAYYFTHVNHLVR
ncbi:MAG: serine/threonine-protein kinase [Myxococcota bacterium]